jgi:hypothetical protein
MEVAAVEYITGSRTVFGVISTPFRLRLLHNVLPFLLILWALSPLGGQASLRVVFLHGVVSNETVPVSYLDSFSHPTSSLKYWVLTKVAFNSALLAPPSSKMGHRDLFGNVKVPLLEDFESQSRQADAEGWYSIKTDETLKYSSLIGLATAGMPQEDRKFLNIETSYLSLDCLLTRQDKLDPNLHYDWHGDSWELDKPLGTCYSGGSSQISLSLARDLKYNTNISDPSTAPRTIYFGHRASGHGQSTLAKCSTTTTYVEMSYTCSGKECVATAIRRSRLTHMPPAITWFDDDLLQGATSELTSIINMFCWGLINSTRAEEVVYNTGEDVLILFLNNPDHPFLDTNIRPVLSDLNNAVFSRRFAQLLNTFKLAHAAPLAVAGGFDPSANVDGFLSNGPGHGVAVNTTATLEKTKIVLEYNTTWLAVLIASSLVMLAAGIATVILNLMRRGPEVLDSFASMLRENQYAQEETGPSTEDASEKVRRLRKTRVMLGDVHPLEMTGHVAVTTRIDGGSVQPLRSGRLYY